ncbi:MAG TPA: hypothetical protein VK456_01080 [Xanthobacteraceae bacterium]|nr:hypothetical protein [Xanthobacteraceae bacterium]
MSGTGRRAGSARGLAFSRAWPGILACLALALAAGGCANAPASTASLGTDRGASIAFESIDGPPVAVFQNLVTTLSAEAAARRVRVVSRTGDPAYRVRGYLAALVVGGKSHISWVWDVYDADKRRVFRIAGEEAGGRAGANAWGAADEQMVRRIARASMDRLVAFLAAPSAPPAGEPAPQPGQPAIASDEGGAPAPTLALAR